MTMRDLMQEKQGKPLRAWYFYVICAAITAVLFLAAPGTGNGYPWLYLGIFIILILALRPGSHLHSRTMESTAPYQTICTVLIAIITIAVCILPMDKLPLWNGEIPGHRNQYELMTEAILEGRIDFAYGDEETLLQLENPYDPIERKEARVFYHWDHAYYNGHYYMYFGIVPVFLAFLPYRVLTGVSLTTFHATQWFVAAAIAGIFALFHLLSNCFFRKLPYSAYVALSVAFSVMSVWYSTAEPALYCTAITSAIALMVWSLYFFAWAVWKEKRENRQILLATVGAAFGALAFGCRPPIALANLLVIPLLVVFLKEHKFTWKLLGKLFLAALPYAVVAAALMWYNNTRFDSPFEFGQAYQLTVADQSNYRFTLDTDTVLRIINETAKNFFSVGSIRAAFPYLHTSSVFFNFPILLLCVGLLRSDVIRNMRKVKLLPFVITLCATVFLISAMDIIWSPYLLERYRMDIYFLMGILCFIIIGMWFNTCEPKPRKRLCSAVTVFSLITVVSAFLLCIQTVGVYYPKHVTAIAEALHLL